MLLAAAALGAPATVGMQQSPHQPFVQLSDSLLISPTVASFGRIEGGSPLAYLPAGWGGLGVTAQVGLTGMTVPAEERSWFGVRSLAMGVWALFESDTVHQGVGFTAGYSPEPGMIELVAHEGSSHGGLSYRLRVQVEPARFGLEIDTGFNGSDVFHATLSPWASISYGPFETHLRALGGLQTLSAVSLGTAVRAGGLSIDVTGHLVVPLERSSRVHLMPQLTLRHDWRWKKAGDEQSGWGEAIGD